MEFIFFEFSKERVIFSYVVELRSQFNVSASKKNFHSFDKSSENMMCMRFVDDMARFNIEKRKYHISNKTNRFKYSDILCEPIKIIIKSK